MKNLFFWALLCVLIAGSANGLMDTLQFHYNQTGFDEMSTYWNPTWSWRNKYALCGDNALCQPLQERFWGSTTVFSFVTDAWHLAKFVHLNAVRVAILLMATWALSLKNKNKFLFIEVAGILILLAAVHSAGFHLIYTLIF